jgi:hypothetical protein
MALLGSSIAQLGEHEIGFYDGSVGGAKLIVHEFAKLG